MAEITLLSLKFDEKILSLTRFFRFQSLDQTTLINRLIHYSTLKQSRIRLFILTTFMRQLRAGIRRNSLLPPTPLLLHLLPSTPMSPLQAPFQPTLLHHQPPSFKNLTPHKTPKGLSYLLAARRLTQKNQLTRLLRTLVNPTASLGVLRPFLFLAPFVDVLLPAPVLASRLVPGVFDDLARILLFFAFLLIELS